MRTHTKNLDDESWEKSSANPPFFNCKREDDGIPKSEILIEEHPVRREVNTE